MPILTVNTNVKAVPANFKTHATEVIAKTLSKPASFVAVAINPGQDISFGGTDEPAALCELVSIGGMSVELNKKHAKNIMTLLESALKVPPTRTYISFKDVDKADVGYNTTTFDDLL